MLNNRDNAKQYIHDLYNMLNKESDKSSHMLNITDVLLQVYSKIDKAKNPEALIDRLAKYIYSEGMAGKIHLKKEEEALLMELGTIGQKAGLNGANYADFSDKSYFYSIFDNNKMPIR
ncbi:bacteriocin immunity protein [Companilactobacillus allii]|uniref:Bacteriocin immunity protein n=1 Tax=Companilactobacillus allii TaxID=1847728 RepID=A0A1P8Q1F4_9LACO|nr:bacteriocin immunity protein [Companilactobacillus allii]APX71651.1 bacteriocin immunity protein [Companilactobacillus allii]USQ68734.1 bacteriocin immunity protein [Companilactobacillus allii]